MKLRTRMILVFGVAGALSAGGAAYALATDDHGDGVSGDDARRAVDAALAEVGSGTVTEIEADDGGYDVEVRTVEGRSVDVALGQDFEVRYVERDEVDDIDDDMDDVSGGQDDVVAGDPARQSAIDAALEAVGGGTAIDVERDGTGYDVEVRDGNGRTTDVDLDADFNVVRTELDD